MRCHQSRLRIHRLLLVGICSWLMSGLGYALSDQPTPEAEPPPAKIVLLDGSIVFGEITDIADGSIQVATFWMGDIVIPLDAILKKNRAAYNGLATAFSEMMSGDIDRRRSSTWVK